MADKLLVLTGAAGTGKRTIAREISRQVKDEKRLAASVFFSRGFFKENIEGTFRRVAVQVSELHECLQPHFHEALCACQGQSFASPEEKMEALVMSPMKRCLEENPNVESQTQTARRAGV